MPETSNDYEIAPVERLDLHLVDGEWPFAQQNQAEIKAHWKALTRANPALFNGNLLLMVDGGLEHGLFSCRLIEVDYASFIAWRDWGWPDKTVHDCYGSAVVFSNDDALIMGRMAAHTANAGMIYPPGGSLTRQDVSSGTKVDLLASIARELEEETGLRSTDSVSEGLYMATSDQRIAIGQVLRFPAGASKLVEDASAFIARENPSELEGIVALFRQSNLPAQLMPPHARAFSAELLERIPTNG